MNYSKKLVSLGIFKHLVTSNEFQHFDFPCPSDVFWLTRISFLGISLFREFHTFTTGFGLDFTCRHITHFVLKKKPMKGSNRVLPGRNSGRASWPLPGGHPDRLLWRVTGFMLTPSGGINTFSKLPFAKNSNVSEHWPGPPPVMVRLINLDSVRVGSLWTSYTTLKFVYFVSFVICEGFDDFSLAFALRISFSEIHLRVSNRVLSGQIFTKND